MTSMSESFVDLSYRGLALGKRIKLTQVRPQSGYLEMPTPMPVGTTIGIATEDGLQLEAVVAEVREQTGGSEQPPGMLVKPTAGGEAQDAWWRSRIDHPDAGREKDKAPPPADADGKVTLVSPRMSGSSPVPELLDDGRDTGVMEAISGADLVADPPDTVVAEIPVAPGAATERGGGRDTIVVPMGEPMPVEEGSRTMAMDAVDLAALGLSQSGQYPAVKAEDYSDAPSGPVPEKPDGGKAKKKRGSKRRG
jgi:hypothetical protein